MKNLDFTIRELTKRDNRDIEAVIRSCLIEFGANHQGTAWADPMLGRFSEIYKDEKNKYWVAVDATGRLVGGVGIGEMEGLTDICELQKMYCLPEVRGTGLAHSLINTALSYAEGYYTSVYLETLENMLAAQKFYKKYGFKRIDGPLGNTGHYACDVCYIKKL